MCVLHGVLPVLLAETVTFSITPRYILDLPVPLLSIPPQSYSLRPTIVGHTPSHLEQRLAAALQSIVASTDREWQL